MKKLSLAILVALCGTSCVTRSDDPISIEFLAFCITAQPEKDRPHLASAVVIAAAVGRQEFTKTKIWPKSPAEVIEKIAPMKPEDWVIEQLGGFEFSVVGDSWQIADKATRGLVATVDREGGLRIARGSPVLHEGSRAPSGNSPSSSIGGIVLSEFVSQLGNTLSR